MRAWATSDRATCACCAGRVIGGRGGSGRRGGESSSSNSLRWRHRLVPRSKVSPEIRAAALSDLAGGEQPAIVAERYGLDRELVKKWKVRYVPTDVPTDVPVVVPVPAVR